MVKPVLVVLASVALLVPWQDPPQQLELESLKKLVEQMGYKTEQSEGANNFEFLTQRDELDIPISAEVSESRNFVWFTVFLGDPAMPELLERHPERAPGGRRRVMRRYCPPIPMPSRTGPIPPLPSGWD